MTDIYQPRPLNQFYRLEYDERIRKWVKTATRWNDVVNGHNFDAENCMAAGGGVALDAHTGGALRKTPIDIRGHQSDFSGGIGVDDVAQAWRAYGQTLLTPADFNFAEVIYAIRSEHRAVLAGGDYDQVPDAYSCQIGGTFDHAFVLNDVRSDGAIGVFDSLCTNKHYIPQYVMRNSLEKLALRVRGTRGALFVGLTRKRPDRAAAITYTVHFAANARVRVYALGSSGCISSWADHSWGAHSSSAQGTGYRHRDTCDGKSGAYTVRLTSGMYDGATIQVGSTSGITVTRN